MAIAAGEIVTAGRLNRLQPVTYKIVATTLLDRTDTTEADIPGATVTFSTTASNALFVVEAHFDCEARATSASVLILGKLMVDGVSQTGTSVKNMVALTRDTVSQSWDGTLATAGSHTIKLRGNLSGSLATGGRFHVTNTRAVITIYEVA